jgi:tellurite resistance protein TerB
MLKNFFAKAAQTASDLKAGALKFKNRKFLNACVSGAFMVSVADGNVDAEERKKLLTFMKSDDALSVYETTDIIEAFTDIEKAYSFDRDSGDAKAMKSISAIKNDTAESRFLVRMIISIASSDNNIDDSERKVILKICKELSLDSSEFI